MDASEFSTFKSSKRSTEFRSKKKTEKQLSLDLQCYNTDFQQTFNSFVWYYPCVFIQATVTVTEA